MNAKPEDGVKKAQFKQERIRRGSLRSTQSRKVRLE
jgi:hypothetical protein